MPSLSSVCFKKDISNFRHRLVRLSDVHGGLLETKNAQLRFKFSALLGCQLLRSDCLYLSLTLICAEQINDMPVLVLIDETNVNFYSSIKKGA